VGSRLDLESILGALASTACMVLGVPKELFYYLETRFLG